MEYRTVHTIYGLQQQAAAAVSGASLDFTHMAVGDGGGVEAAPDPERTQLVNEVYRAPVNRIYQVPGDGTRYIAELLIPAAIGGFTIREAAIFDASGAMVVVGNVPSTVKPQSSDGAFADTGLRMEFVVSNDAAVTLAADPNTAVATQGWIEAHVTPASLLPGGTTGQILSKVSNADGDVEWRDPGAISVTVDTIEERQVLAAGQTAVVLAECTTRGLALYIDGKRLPDTGWTKHATDPVKLTLAAAATAGQELIAVQNEPTGDAPAPLERSRNLSDLENKTTARQNLGVFSQAQTRQMAPAGQVAYFAFNTAPAGWLKANGAPVSRTAYADLFAAIGTKFGVGDGATTFNLPDLRGEFVRGWDDGRGVDAGRFLGSAQGDANKTHTHTASSVANGAHIHTGAADAAAAHSHAGATAYAGGHTHETTISEAGKHYHASGWGASPSEVDPAPHGWIGGFADKPGSTVTDFNNFEFRTSEDGTHNHAINLSAASSHTHTFNTAAGGSHGHTLKIDSGGAHSHAITVNASGIAEARPRNIALLACIKF